MIISKAFKSWVKKRNTYYLISYLKDFFKIFKEGFKIFFGVLIKAVDVQKFGGVKSSKTRKEILLLIISLIRKSDNEKEMIFTIKQ